MERRVGRRRDGTVLLTDRLARASWGDVAPSTTAGTLQVHVSQLPRPATAMA